MCCVCGLVTNDASRATEDPSKLLETVFISCSRQIPCEDTYLRIGHDIIFRSLGQFNRTEES